jgi:hypothetical protein
MSARVLRFPLRQSHAIWITREDAAWLVLAHEHGWLHGSRSDALEDAHWLARTLGLPIRQLASAAFDEAAA